MFSLDFNSANSDVVYPVPVDLPGLSCPVHRYRSIGALPLCSVITLHTRFTDFNLVIVRLMQFVLLLKFFLTIFFYNGVLL